MAIASYYTKDPERVIVSVRTAPVILDDSSELFSEVNFLVNEMIQRLVNERISSESMSTDTQLCGAMSEVLTRDIGVALTVKTIYHHYNMQYADKSVMVGIEVTPQTLIDYENRGVPTFEDVFKDFK